MKILHKLIIRIFIIILNILIASFPVGTLNTSIIYLL